MRAAPRSPLENAVQRAVVGYLKAVLPGVLVFAVPNAAVRKRDGKAGNAVPGLKPGMPDLGFMLKPSRWRADGPVYWIEVKRPGGTLAAEQIECHRELRAHGAQVAVVDSVDEMRLVLDTWNIPTREARHETELSRSA